MLAKSLALGFSSAVLLSLVACSGADSSGGSSYGPGKSTSNETGDTSSAGSGFGGGNSSGASSSNGSGSSTGNSSCATSTVTAQAKPVYLAFAYDQSGSMSFDGKWDAANAAMKSFFTSANATGLNASLTFFPKYDVYPQFCSVSDYASPDVGVTALPSPVFGAALDATAPQAGQGGTPTVAALTGTMGYAQQLQATTAKDATVAVVMVTDGVPEVCSDKGDVGPASLVAAANAATIPTYVVGVGDDLQNLNEIALAGGTKQAFVVSVGNPAQTQADLTSAVNTIKAAAVSCEYKVPSPTGGLVFDPKKTNVQYTPTGAAATAIGYDQTCMTGQGWRYDDATNPTEIIACDATCSDIKTKGGKVDVVFGCDTQNVAVK